MKDQIKDLVEIRNYLSWDKNFIYQTWLKGLYYGNEFFKQMNADDFYKNYEHVITRILMVPDLQIKVACLKEDAEVVLGYAIFKGDTLHWIFVKPTWRKLGIAKDLIPDTIKSVTHLTKVGKSIKPKKWAFNPFLL
jgi:GNAT superfamily N-acetyltransferase